MPWAGAKSVILFLFGRFKMATTKKTATKKTTGAKKAAPAKTAVSGAIESRGTRRKQPQTISARAQDIKRQWHLVDADGVVVGRMASRIANILRGKNKTNFTPHTDCGDFVIVINAAKAVLTGNKMEGKLYRWHTGYPGGLKQRTPKDVMAGKFPERIIKDAVKNMVPRGPLGRHVLTKLFVYADAAHPHEAQQPKPLDIAGMNPKNKRQAA